MSILTAIPVPALAADIMMHGVRPTDRIAPSTSLSIWLFDHQSCHRLAPSALRDAGVGRQLKTSTDIGHSYQLPPHQVLGVASIQLLLVDLSLYRPENSLDNYDAVTGHTLDTQMLEARCTFQESRQST